MPTLTARAIKITLVLDPTAVRDALAPVQTTAARIPFTIAVEGRKLTIRWH